MLRNLIVYASILLIFSSCQKEISTDLPPHQDIGIGIRIHAVVSGDNLKFGEEYSNVYQEPFTVSAFKFYIHSIELENTETGIRTLIDDTYHLIDFEEPASTLITGTANTGSYNRLNFILGIDSALNVSGAQEGSLDPAKGMFWTWNSGYIMAKLEGNSEVASTPNHSFEYHIGGFSGDHKVVKKISVSLPGNETIDLMDYTNPLIQVNADINKWFEGTNEIRISTNPTCMTPGELAGRIAQNYYKMFTVTTIVSGR